MLRPRMSTVYGVNSFRRPTELTSTLEARFEYIYQIIMRGASKQIRHSNIPELSIPRKNLRGNCFRHIDFQFTCINIAPGELSGVCI